MFKFINYYRKEVTKRTILAFVTIVFITSVVFIVGATYASGSFTIIFNRAEGTEVMKTCKTDVNGKLDDDCIATVGAVCSRWSPDKYYGTPQSNQIPISSFSNMTFTEDSNYYCVGGSSGTYNMGCYICKTDDTIMHWSANGNANDNCPSGYSKSTNILTEEDCKVIVPEVCYICNDNKNVMKWDNNGDPDNNCSSGYTEDNNKNETECKPIKNPQTGEVLIIFIFVGGFLSLCYGSYYFKKLQVK